MVVGWLFFAFTEVEDGFIGGRWCWRFLASDGITRTADQGFTTLAACWADALKHGLTERDVVTVASRNADGVLMQDGSMSSTAPCVGTARMPGVPCRTRPTRAEPARGLDCPSPLRDPSASSDGDADSASRSANGIRGAKSRSRADECSVGDWAELCLLDRFHLKTVDGWHRLKVFVADCPASPTAEANRL